MTALSKYIKQPVSGDLSRYTDSELRKIESVFSVLTQRIDALEALTEQTTGTFNPTIEGSGASGVGTYSVRDGFYMKQGKLVVCLGRIQWSAHTGTGNIVLTTFPFTPANNVGDDANYIVNYVKGELGGTDAVNHGLLRPGLPQALLFDSADAQVAMSATGSLIFSFTYYTD
jgi:hypothetical protein